MAVARDSKPGHEYTRLCSMRCIPNLRPELSLGAAPGCSPHSILGGDGDPVQAQHSKPSTSTVQGWTPQQKPGRQGWTDGQADGQQGEPQAEQSAEASSGDPFCCTPSGVMIHPSYTGDPSYPGHEPRSH